MTLPARTAVLNYLSKEKTADVNQVMNDLKNIYGTEKQFTKDLFLGHLMSLKANGLLEQSGYDLDDNGELAIQFTITADGIASANKYIPAQYK